MSVTRRKPLNKNVRAGLRRLSTLVEAGSSDDIMGYSVEQMDAEQRREWQQVLSACEWINSLKGDDK
jgi:hypothetical protein